MENEERMCRNGWNAVEIFTSEAWLQALLKRARANLPRGKTKAKPTRDDSPPSGGSNDSTSPPPSEASSKKKPSKRSSKGGSGRSHLQSPRAPNLLLSLPSSSHHRRRSPSPSPSPSPSNSDDSFSESGSSKASSARHRHHSNRRHRHKGKHRSSRSDSRSKHDRHRLRSHSRRHHHSRLFRIPQGRGGRNGAVVLQRCLHWRSQGCFWDCYLGWFKVGSGSVPPVHEPQRLGGIGLLFHGCYGHARYVSSKCCC